MRFAESEKLASSKPNLKELVVQCDQLLADVDADAIVIADSWASLFGEDVARVEAVLQEYVGLGLLRSQSTVECDCGAMISSGTCPTCGLPALDGVRKIVYAFADKARALKPKQSVHPVSPAIPVAHGRPSATFGIVTALDYEFAAIETMLDERKDWRAAGRGAGRRYVVGKIPARTGGVHDVAALLLVESGNNQASARAALLLEHFPEMKYVIMCGIAGGIPRSASEHDVRLGDIVVTDRGGVIQYDFGKDEGGKWTPRHSPRPPGAELLEAMKLLSARAHLGDRPWEVYLSRTAEVEGAERPPDNVDAQGNVVTYAPDSARRSGLPRVFFASIASSNCAFRSIVIARIAAS